jgi:putative tricarboxylic transport membrane protein
MIEHLFNGLIVALSLPSILAMITGTIIGLGISALPGLSTTMVIALAIPFTYGLDPFAALGLLAGIHNGASQGGAIPAILLKIPGNPGSIATAWDGYPMAQQGHAGPAIQLAAVSSAVGGMLSALALILLAPPLADVALAFGPAEIFWVNIFGLASIAALLGDDVIKGVVSACVGLLIGTVGIDAVTGQERFTFGSMSLISGLPDIAIFVGMLSLPPAWELASRSHSVADAKAFAIHTAKGVWRVAEVYKVWLKSSVIGIIIGILPGSAISAFIAYNEAKRSSKEPERFGHGSHEGLAAAESVNNADNAAAMIPTLTLGIPGSNIAALMLGALMIQGFQPGPQLFHDAPDIVYGYAWQMFITSALLIALGGIVASRIFAQLLKLSPLLLLPLIICTTVAGSFASDNSIFSVYMALLFGLVGVGMNYFGIPVAPAIIGLVLGAKAEFNLRIALLISQGSFTIFFHGLICWILIALTVAVLTYPVIGYFRQKRRGDSAPNPAGASADR